LALFAVFPLAGFLRILPSKDLKHLYSLLVGLFLAQWIFGADWFHFFITSTVTYLLCAIVPKKYVHIVVFVWAMGYMTGAHVYRMYVSYMSGIFDFTGTQMVLTMKLTSFAYNLYDGTADKKRVFAKHEDKRLARVSIIVCMH
jgi:lysophospholipid acyltransferase